MIKVATPSATVLLNGDSQELASRLASHRPSNKTLMAGRTRATISLLSAAGHDETHTATESHANGFTSRKPSVANYAPRSVSTSIPYKAPPILSPQNLGDAYSAEGNASANGMLQPSPLIDDRIAGPNRPSLSLSGGPSIHSFQDGIRLVLQTLYQDFCQIKALRLEHAFSTIRGTQTDTIHFVALCTMWYISSALSSSTGKEILGPFRYPVTLTFVQFGFVAGYCLCLAKGFGMTRIRPVNRSILASTFPMALFQIAGHVFSSMAISRVPVSTVHTIKALSPLFTVAAYSLLFQVTYNFNTYFSLLPLTLGVMLACSFDLSTSNEIGFLCAFGSCLIFVSQNIFSKKLLYNGPQVGGPRGGPKLDKLNLLFYSSGLAFLLMIPLWLYADGLNLLWLWSGDKSPANGQGGRVVFWLFLNGLVHFAQNILAFSVLASTSTVTYSIASLIKRIFVIVASIIYFGQTTTAIQAFGILLTFVGLYLYNQAKADVNRGERRVRQVEAEKTLILPMTKLEAMTLDGHAKLTPPITPFERPSTPERLVNGHGYTQGNGMGNGHGHPLNESHREAVYCESPIAIIGPQDPLMVPRLRAETLREGNNHTPVTEVPPS